MLNLIPMEITLEQMREAMKHDYPVTVIINGEYYVVKDNEGSEDNEQR